MRAAIGKYVVLPSDEALTAVTLWVAATHIQTVLQHAPRLAVVGPTKGCGKSVVVGARGRLAVECDGDAFHHATREQIENDQRRDRALKRVGWEFWRVRESEFRFDPEAALDGLWEELDRQEIRPASYARSTPAAQVAGSQAEWKPLDLSSDDGLTDDEDTGDEQTDDRIDDDTAEDDAA